MRKLKYLYLLLRLQGLDPIRFVNFYRGIPFYIKNYIQIKRQLKYNEDFKFGKVYPILSERFEDSGDTRSPYFRQDLHVASRVFANNPERHIDIGSRIDGFVAHVASFRSVNVFDIRPLESTISNITFTRADLMNLPQHLIQTCDSISSLHAIEHFGLGRYSDPIDAEGHIKAINNIHKMLKENGTFYFSVPIGPQRIEFNAHRVFSIAYLLKIFAGIFEITHFSYINDNGDFFEHQTLTSDIIVNDAHCIWDAEFSNFAKFL